MIFILTYIFSPSQPDFLIGFGLFSLLLIVTMTDLKAMIIPDKAIIFFGCYFILIHGIYFYPEMLLDDLAGILFGLGCPIIVWNVNRDGIGFDDIKLFLLLGFIFGPHDILLCIILSCVLGIFYVLIVRLIKFLYSTNIPLRTQSEPVNNKKAIPFAPFISLAAMFTYLWGNLFLSYFNM